MTQQTDHVLLVILDGWGKGQRPEVDALQQGQTPFVDSLYRSYPNAELVTYGEQVGLPEGQMGNSEVGHLNIGAGRVVYQDFARINRAVRTGELAKLPMLQNALERVKIDGGKLHLMGLLSDGGVHSHIDHLKTLCDIVTESGVQNCFVHAFTDGRDTAPTGGLGYLTDLLDHTAAQPVQLASVVGRYYAMDRDTRWERIRVAYDCLVHGTGERTSNVLDTLQTRYGADETDEFLKPIICTDDGTTPRATIDDGDTVLFFNFRTDRPRQLTTALTQRALPEHGMKPLRLHYYTMTRYDEAFNDVQVLFSKSDLVNTLGETISRAGLTQTRIAETEKYPHVTFFFNGGREAEFAGEHRILIPSPKVATYDLQPEMSAFQVTDAIIADIQERAPNFICLNYANTDMVGHTGDWEAAKAAAQAVDGCLHNLVKVARNRGYVTLIIADHGNSDIMRNEDGSPHTAHTTNPVPIFVVGPDANALTVRDGKLGDLAPTILALLGVDRPAEMDGDILVQTV